METKKCKECHVRKDLTEFYKDRSRPGGYDYRCKACSRVRDANRKRSTVNKNVTARKNNKRRADACETWHYTLARFKSDTCMKCGADGPLEIDHIMPIALGGSNNLFNFQILCRPCNIKKSATFADYSRTGGVVVDRMVA